MKYILCLKRVTIITVIRMEVKQTLLFKILGRMLRNEKQMRLKNKLNLILVE